MKIEFLFTIEGKLRKIFTKSLLSLLIIIVKLLALSSFSSLEKFLWPKTTYFVNEQQAVAVGHLIIQLDNFKSNFYTTFL